MSRSIWGAIVTVTLFATTSFAGWFPAQQFPTGDMPYGVAEGDFDKDGHPDLAAVNLDSDDVTVLLGNSDGTFATAATYAVGGGPYSVAVGDFNGDGNADLVVPGSESRDLTVLLGNGDGTFAAKPAYAR